MAWSVTVGTRAEADATSISPVAPAGSSGALLALCYSQENRAVPTTPTGWTDGGEVATFGSSTGCGIFYRIGDGTATDSPTVSFASSQTRHAIILKITGQAASSPYDTNGLVGAGDSTNTNAILTPAMTLAQAGELLVAVTVNSNELSDYTWPGTWTERDDHGSTAGKLHRYSVATREVASSGSYSAESVVLSVSNNRRGMVVVAFKPEATTGSPWNYYAQQQAAAL